MLSILDATQTTGDEFYPPGGTALILLTGHAGGTWQLEVQAPDGTWVEDEMTFTDNGIKAWFNVAHLKYRLTGGNAGAKAWVFSNGYKPGRI